MINPLRSNKPDSNNPMNSAGGMANSAADVYAAPNSVADTPLITQPLDYNDGNWHSLNGRIGRIQHLAFQFIWTLMIIPIFFIAVFAMVLIPIVGMVSLVLLILPTVYTFILLPRRRLHDIGRSGWWLLLWFIPIVNLLMILYICFMPGEEGYNDYGNPSSPYTTVQLVLAIGLPLLYTASAVMTDPDELGYSDYFGASGEESVAEDNNDAEIAAERARIEAEMATEQGLNPTSDVTINDDGSFNLEWEGEEGASDTDDMPVYDVDPNSGEDWFEEGAYTEVQEETPDQTIVRIRDELDMDDMQEGTVSGNQSEMINEAMEVQAAIDEAINEPSESTEMSFEEFMNSDTQIMVE